MQTKVQYEMAMSDVGARIETLALAGLRIAVDNADAMHHQGLEGMQAVLEQINDLALPLYNRLETLEREETA